MTYAFTFDAKFCSGCKACQAACKDKNNLPVGVLWRRVYEVSGGTWQRNGEAWDNTVFAYNLSMSCNHCVHPKCAGVCPVKAYDVREDGIVILDSDKCIGCGYCAWACPYGAPQYNPQAGYMTKCDFCYDNLDQGLHPACVAACPMRVLDYGETETEKGIALWNVPPETHPFPLPVYSHTQPRLVIKPHTSMQTSQEKSVANPEETQPQTSSTWDEAPLILFTLLGQMAVGGFWAMSLMFPPLWAFMAGDTTVLRLIPSLLIGTSLGAGMVFSFAHLGTKRNAWRVLAHLRRSWLSREILFAGLFGLGWLVIALEGALWERSTIEWMGITAALGFGLVYSMARVYRLPSAPGWNTWRTNAGFIASALLLGLAVMVPVLAYETEMTGIQLPVTQWKMMGGGILILLVAQLTLMQRRVSKSPLSHLRTGLILIGIFLTAVAILRLSNVIWFGVPIFLIVAMEEVLGRWLFYRSRIL